MTREAAEYGRALQDWLERTGETAEWLAHRIGRDPSTVSKRLKGERVPDSKSLVKELNVFREALGERWSVAEALGGVAWLGKGWGDVRGYAEQWAEAGEISVDFVAWWGEREPKGRAIFVASRPVVCVARRLQAEWLDALVGMEGYQRPSWRGMILYGVAGIGKTTLATVLATDDRVKAAFLEGVLWIDASTASPEAWLEELCQALGLERARGERWSDCWRRWAGQRRRRFLLVIDDLVDTGHLGSLVAGLGEQCLVLVTTQEGEAARLELERWLPAGRVWNVAITGLEQEAGRRLVEGHLARSLKEEEWPVVREIGECLGWHPEALRLAVTEGGVDAWRALLAEFRREGLSLVSVDRMLRRQWERLAAPHRGWIDALLRQLRRGGPFTPAYAADVWGVDVEVARRRLRTLEWTGMVEQLEETHDALGIAGELWHVTPVVYRTFGRIRAGRKPKTLRERWAGFRAGIREQWLRWQLAHLVYQYGGGSHRMPVRFGVWMALWWFVWGIIKVGLGLPIGLADLLARRGWSRRWREGTIVLSAEHHLKVCWAQRGRAPTEDLLLLYDARDVASLRSVLGVLVGIAVGIAANLAASAFPFGSLGQWLLNGLSLAVLSVMALAYVATAWPVAWRVWVAHLYGVETWDIKVGLWMAGRLRREPKLRTD